MESLKSLFLFFITSDDTYSRTLITCTLKGNKKKMIKLEKFEVGILLITNKELYFYHLPFLYIKFVVFFFKESLVWKVKLNVLCLNNLYFICIHWD